MDEKKVQIQSGEDTYLQLSRGGKRAALVSGGDIQIGAATTIAIVSTEDKPVTVKASEVAIKAAIKHASLKVTE